MIQSYHQPYRSVPLHWIGVEKGWEEAGYTFIEKLVCLPPHLLRKHIYAIGSTGAGKTNLLHQLIAQDILYGYSFCIIDMRGNLVDAALELAAGHVLPSKVCLLNLREKHNPHGFDPLAGAGEPYFRSLAILDAVASESESWGVQLAETLRMALLLLTEAKEPLTQLEALFYNPQLLYRCLEACTAENVISFWNSYMSLSRERQTAMALPVLNKVSLLFAASSTRKMLSHPKPLDLAVHLNTPGSILLVNLAIDELHGAGKMMGKIILSSIVREVFSRVTSKENARNPTRLYVDEFEHFGMMEFENILAEARNYRLSLCLAHQTLSQLSPKMRSLILGNASTKFVFRCGREDSYTLSRDLVNDPKLIDFTDFPVGETILWNSELGLKHVEVNEPLLQDMGGRSPRVDQFVQSLCPPTLSREVGRLSMPLQEALEVEPPILEVPAPQAHIIQIPSPQSLPRSVAKQQPTKAMQFKSNLEDWLQ